MPLEEGAREFISEALKIHNGKGQAAKDANDQGIQMSIAYSLKRIADVMEAFLEQASLDEEELEQKEED